MPRPEEALPRHILILTDRDWTHPQGGGTGTNLYGQVSRWLAWGHRVTVVAGAHADAPAYERPAPNLEIHRMGSRLTVFARAFWAVQRGVGRDADVVLEVVNGIAFFTPLWPLLRRPRLTLVHHVHREMYVTELGRTGAVAAWLLETLPLRWLYRGSRVLTISGAVARDLAGLGLPEDTIDVVHLGVEDAAFARGVRAVDPTLLYLGRLKRYKRLDVLLDVLEAVPEARLEVAGDGDHRAAFEAEVAARGLQDRVTLHGFVDEERKQQLYGRAWLALTASSAEGWCLTVMEAAACATPSAALAVGGLKESIVDGETGILAATPAELAARVALAMRDEPAREAMGAAAERRAREFTWERTAAGSLRSLEGAIADHDPARRAEERRAALLAALSVGSSAAALVFLVALARLLGAGGFGELAGLVAALLVLALPAAAVQVAIARATAGVRDGGQAPLRAALRPWWRRLAAAAAVAGAAGVVLREPLAALLGVDATWAAAALPNAGALCVVLAVQRGVLQGLGRYGAVGVSIVAEAGGRILAGLALVLAGAGVTGAFLAIPLALAVTAAVLALVLRAPPRRATAQTPLAPVMETRGERLGEPQAAPAVVVHGPLGEAPAAPFASAPAAAAALRRGLRASLPGAAGLALLAVLLNGDVLVALHGDLDAGAYAAASVLAKGALWCAVGPATYVLPAAARRAHGGRDARPLLVRAGALLALPALPVLLVSLLAGGPALRLLFGSELDAAAGALPWLVVAAALLGCAFLAVAHALAAGDRRALGVLAIAAAAQLAPLAAASGGAETLAAALAAMAAAATGALLALPAAAARAAPA